MVVVMVTQWLQMLFQFIDITNITLEQNISLQVGLISLDQDNVLILGLRSGKLIVKKQEAGWK